MSARQFKESQERYGGQWRIVARVSCRKCGVSDSIGLSTVGGLLPPNIITKKMQQRGWTIGANEQWDYCPGCTNTMKEAKPAMLKVVDQDAKPMSPVERMMCRKDPFEVSCVFARDPVNGSCRPDPVTRRPANFEEKAL